jgi:hypothetical protein
VSVTPNDPTPAEIAAACEQIRSRWSEAETRKRSAWAVSEPVTVVEAEIEVSFSDT